MPLEYVFKITYFSTFSQDLTGWTPLTYAIHKNHLEIAEVLIDNHADIHLEDKFKFDPLSRAITDDNQQIVELLSRKGVDVNKNDSIGWLPIHTAIDCKNTKILIFLLQNGADINKIEVHEGWNALCQAIHDREANIVKILLRHGANPNLPNRGGKSPVTFAIYNKDTTGTLLPIKSIANQSIRALTNFKGLNLENLGPLP